MNGLAWLRLVLSCCFVWNAGIGRTVETTTKGGQDKRPGTLGRYGIVVVGFFASFAESRSADLNPICLISIAFNRATCPSGLVRP